MTNLRPISFYNVCYKVISKILTKRIGIILPKLISREQGAFIKGRSIHDNVALTQKLVQSLNGGLPGANLKLNLDM